jgi:hypothetical protein
MNVSSLRIGYRAHAKDRDNDATFWAFEAMHALVDESPGDAWEIVRDLIAETVDDTVLAYIAAGPLEELIVRHGALLIDAIEATAARDARMCRALVGVWGHERMSPDVRRRIGHLIRDESPL